MVGMPSFEGKVAVVTGGASGIGRAIAEELVAGGARVVIADVDGEAVERSAGEIGAVGVPADVSNPASMEAFAEQVRAKFGTVHILYNNAGVGAAARVEDMTSGDWQWMLGVNLWGVIHGLRLFLPMMIQNGEQCHIATTASLAGFSTMSQFGAYSATKYAVIGLSEALAIEMAADHPQIGVSVLCPGPVTTRLETSTRSRPAALAGAFVDRTLEKATGAEIVRISPAKVARVALAAIRDGSFYALPQPVMAPRLRRRLDAIEAAFTSEVA